MDELTTFHCTLLTTPLSLFLLLFHGLSSKKALKERMSQKVKQSILEEIVV